MRRLIDALAERVGLPTADFLAVQLASLLAADEETAIRFMAKILNDADECRNAVKHCVEMGWVALLPTGLLSLTHEGEKLLGERADRFFETIMLSSVS
jgi:hypothetical protein